MSVQFLINGIHPNGTPGLVETTKEDWFKIISKNYDLPEDQQRFFYRDVIVENGKTDIVFMEVSKDIYRRWENSSRKTRRIYEAKRMYTHVSLDELIAVDSAELISDELLEDYVFSKNFISCLRAELLNEADWMSKLLSMYLNGDEKYCVKYLMQHYNIGRSRAFFYKQLFEAFVKNFFVKNWTI